MIGKRNTPADFWLQVDKDGPTQPHMATPCWLWRGKVWRRYGQFWFGNQPQRAHRLAWRLHYGALSSEEWVLHRCDVHLCVRPDHLFLGDHAANMADMVRKGRSLAGARHNSVTKPWIVPRGVDHPVHKNPLLVTGERNPAAKLTEAQVREIHILLGLGVMTLGAIGARYGVSTSAIHLISKRKKWKHVNVE